jgi:hypothetical protein
MRAAIYQYLSTNCALIETWLPPFKATAATPKPYGVIVLGEEIPSVDNRLGLFLSLTIWPYFAESASPVQVDAAVKQIRNLLNGAKLTTSAGARFEIEGGVAGPDFYDDELKALTKRMSFRIPMIGRR